MSTNGLYVDTEAIVPRGEAVICLQTDCRHHPRHSRWAMCAERVTCFKGKMGHRCMHHNPCTCCAPNVAFIDPGETTGLLGLSITPSSIDLDWFSSAVGMGNLQDDLHCLNNAQLLVVEQYVQRPAQRLAQDPIAAKVIGVLTTLRKPMLMQDPSVRRAITKSKLRQMGWWDGLSTHERACAQHALHYLLERRHPVVVKQMQSLLTTLTGA